jgi:hypothetical protein
MQASDKGEYPMRRLFAIAIITALAALVAPAAFAATATPFGGATVSDGVLSLVSNTGDAGTTNDASGATFSGTGVMTFSSLTTLSAEFNVTDDDCKAGSPRFQVRVQTPTGEKNVFVYLGPAPSFTGCAQNTWILSGNLIGSTDGRFDTSQIQAGTQVSTYAQALALVGSLPVTNMSLVVDSGWAFADTEQTVLVRNVKINTSTFYVPETIPPTTGGMNPAQACTKLRTNMGLNAFRAAFGTNINGANAFGKCVSAMARMKNDAARTTAVAKLDQAADHCTNTVKSKSKNKSKQKAQLALRICLKKTL